MIAHTPGRWEWWTSNSWRRLRSDLGRGKTADVITPFVAVDGHADLDVSEADMALIAAAPDMLAILKDMRNAPDPYDGVGGWWEEIDDAIAKATGST